MTKDEALKLALEALGQLWLLGDEAAVIANPAITAIKQARALDKKAENARELGLDYEPVWCGHCNGSGRMVRDPDIGTDQECFVCDGAGVPAAPVHDSACNETLRAQGKGYPRTCKKCGFGPCFGTPKQPPAAPVQEPVAWWNGKHGSPVFAFERDTPGIGLGNPDATPLYTTPPAAQPAVPLTDEQIKQIYTEQTGSFIDDSPWALLDFARAIEAAHGIKEKNT